ncbi:hypothetical protein FCV25MIE_26655 [Fagus crenata]
MASVLCLIPCNQNHNCTKILHLGAQKGSMRCSFVKCESGNDLKWKEINENVAEQIMKGCVAGNWINGLADGVSASQVNGKLLSHGLS